MILLGVGGAEAGVGESKSQVTAETKRGGHGAQESARSAAQRARAN